MVARGEGDGGVGEINEGDQEIQNSGLPWGRSGWESACQCRGRGFEPWSRKIPHATEQLSPCITTTGLVLWSLRATLLRPTHLEPMLRNGRSHRSEKPVHCSGEWPPLAATRESLRSNKDPTQPKINKINKCIKKREKNTKFKL